VKLPLSQRMKWRLFCLKSLQIFFGLEGRKVRSRSLVVGSRLVSLRGFTSSKPVKCSKATKTEYGKLQVVLLCGEPKNIQRQNSLDLVNEYKSLNSESIEVTLLHPDQFGYFDCSKRHVDCFVILYDVMELRTTPWWHNFVYSTKTLRQKCSIKRFVVLLQDDYTSCALLDHYLCLINPDVVYTGARDYVETLFPRYSERGGVYKKCLTAYAPEDPTGQLPLRWLLHSERDWDIGTRVRHLSGIFGNRGSKKSLQAESIKRCAATIGLSTNISTNPEDVFLGHSWIDFLQKCRAVPSSSGGSSLVDKHGLITTLVLNYQAIGGEWDKCLLGRGTRSMIIELDIPGFSPRIFEAAAAGCLLLLDEDCDSLNLVAGRDFVKITNDLESSLQMYKKLLNSPDQMLQMCTRSYEKLIKSGQYNVNTFVLETLGIHSFSKNQELR